ncbi:hypothetical protein ABIA33_004117 [Streptacidiphilus sp. MAP12-16]|uniref:hypothetical protein n=1 Tax=Streptacidiphilus sp. MAP12-16 TaxID=3156300 RepID=UPI003517A42A
MYSWFWHRLPGNTLVRSFTSLLLFVAVVAVLFTWVFPWAEPLLPFGDVTVNNGGTTSVQPVGTPGATPSGAGQSSAPAINGAARPTYVPLAPTGVVA